MDINGAPATDAFKVRDAIVAYGRPGKLGGYIVETSEGIRRRLPDLAEAVRWLGRPERVTIDLPADTGQVDGGPIADTDPAPAGRKGARNPK